jgi:hypothetical protein
MKLGDPNKQVYCHTITREIISNNKLRYGVEYWYFNSEQEFKRSDLYKKQ